MNVGFYGRVILDHVPIGIAGIHSHEVDAGDDLCGSSPSI